MSIVHIVSYLCGIFLSPNFFTNVNEVPTDFVRKACLSAFRFVKCAQPIRSELPQLWFQFKLLFGGVIFF